ncbi:MAG: hypothetical protein ABI678_23235, partial [Kofleriaceae bacterium]
MVRFVALAYAARNSIESSVTATALAETWAVAVAAAAVAGTIAWIARARGSSLFTASWVVAVIGVALALPLSLHLVLRLVIGKGLVGFDEFAWTCVVMTGIAHVVLAMLAGIRAWQLARGKTGLSIFIIYGWCVGVGLLPYLWYGALYVGLTGLVLLPLLYAMAP